MDLKIRNVPEDQVLVIQRKARKFGVSREEYLRRVIQEKAEEDELRVQEKYHKEVLDRLIDTLIENNHLMDKVATHFGIEIDQRNTTKNDILTRDENDDIIKLHYDLQKYTKRPQLAGCGLFFYVPID